ncbi:MAG: PAS domain S-box protein, partial [Deltaproteobacteria bacterium]|nr:PAS domain S-box protein [Deltaproteobacteria bacterium]
ESEVNFRSFFDSIDYFLFVLDQDGLIINVNTTVIRRLGYTEAELSGQHVLTVHPEDRREEAGRIVAGMLAGTETVCPVPLLCKDGNLIWTEILSTPERDANGKIVGYHRICRNISERKSLEDQVRQLAFIDPLTKLPNRRLFNDRLSQTMVA